MRLNIRISLVIVLALVASSIAITQTSKATQSNRWATVINQLLDHPAPPPPMLKEAADAIAEKDRLAMLATSNPAQEPEPPENAPALEVIHFWQRQARAETGKQPSDKMSWRLLDACLQQPGNTCSTVMEYFPNTPSAYERVKADLDQPIPQKPTTFYTAQEGMDFLDQESSRRQFRAWLMQHSSYYRDELIQNARSVSSKNQIHLDNKDSLEALARLDWNTAKPIIESYLNNSEPLVQTLALKLMYIHAMENREEVTANTLRRQLLEMVSNSTVSAFARHDAFSVLASYEWQGRDEWISALLAKENLLSGKNHLLSEYVVAAPLKAAPDKWNPLFRQFIASNNPIVHNNAAKILESIVGHSPNPETLKLLLPWLTDAKWVGGSTEYERERVIKAFGKSQLPEAIPGLLWILQNEKESVRDEAAQALAQYSDPQVISQILPALNSAIKQGAVDDYSLSGMIALLVKFGRLSEQEKLIGLEMYAAECEISIDDWNENRTPRLGDPKTLRGWIGYTLLHHTFSEFRRQTNNPILITESIAGEVMERINVLRQEKPDVAAKLWIIAREWDFPIIDLAMAERIVSADADFEALLKALRRRQRLATNAGTILQPMLQQRGYGSGIAAILLEDDGEIRSILNGKDSEAQMALLACARVIRTALPVESVGKLLKAANKRLALAAERYLESEDSVAARALILAIHPNEALILGGSPNFNPKPKYKESETEWENSLREDVKQGRADEVFAEFEVQTSDTAPFRQNFSVEVRVRGEAATICRRKDTARQECRSLLSGELDALRSLFDDVSFDGLAPLPIPGGGLGGTSFEFVRINKRGGRRVFAANLYSLHSDYGFGLKMMTPHDKLSSFFAKLNATGEYELRYALKEKIKELETLSVDDEHPVISVCGQGPDIRALVKNQKDDTQKWHALREGKLAEEAEQPAMCPIVDAQEDLPESRRSKFGYRPPIWPISAKGFVIRNMDWNDVEGLWLCQTGKEPQLVYRGRAGSILVTPDGRWLIASIREQDESKLVRIDLKTNSVTEIDVDGWVYPVVREPLSGKVIIPIFVYDPKTEKRSEGNKLYDPVTGKLETIIGDVKPLKHQDDRPLQHVAGTNTEFWTAIPDYKAKNTRVGQYDARSFKFTSLMELPDIVFTSTSMWVDEKANWLYIAYNGHLLRLPFLRK